MHSDHQIQPDLYPAENNRGEVLSIHLALGILTLLMVTALIYILNKIVYLYYEPDVKLIVNEALTWSIKKPEEFTPEPVERLQFVLSLICLPVFMVISWLLAKTMKKQLETKPWLCFWINVGGLNLLVIWILVVYLQDSSRPFYIHNVFGKIGLIAGLALYAAIAYFFLTAKIEFTGKMKIIFRLIGIELVALTLFNILLYSQFRLSETDWAAYSETNAVFYSVTQVLAGKTLLVNLNSQYGLYAWFLAPIFKITGLSTANFTITLSILNVIAFLFIYLGVKNVIRSHFLGLIVFLVLVYWQYWLIKLPVEAGPARHYYQYWPIRFLFPALTFYLLTAFFSSSGKRKKYIFLILMLSSSFAVLWNLDSGLVVIISVLLSLVYSAFMLDRGKIVKRIALYLGSLFLSFVFAMGLFTISCVIKSGEYPNFSGLFEFQRIFYLSGYYMLPMSPVHFWHLPVLIYIIAFYYILRKLKLQNDPHSSIIAFLFLLGCGLFSYFQGRSYSTNIAMVMYPSIIILGIFCDGLLQKIRNYNFKFSPEVFAFFIGFIFLIDGACSMVSALPTIQTFSWKNAFLVNEKNEQYQRYRNKFVMENFKKKDTLIILSKNFESYYYALGNYHNPVNVPSSTEIFFKSEVDSILGAIKSAKYAVVYDSLQPVDYSDTVQKLLNLHAYESERIFGNGDLIIYRPKRD